ncbi:MAG TPA: NAD-dependent epimerase/dehydratase family protein [Vicinamibacterales bacterium]|jgi:farnesol dehydrogenase|nr:NAD-dependent epimerase/dehydratase family protein [Vicinamibacterales bacterium]
MKVLVTGGTGYLGRAVVSALAARGHDLIVFARSASRSGLPGTTIDGDIRDRAALERAAAGCDAISHSAALVSIWRRRHEDFDDVNVGGLRNVLAVAGALGIPRVLYTSSFVAIPPKGRTEPLVANDYQRSKVAADRLADEAVRGGAPLVRVYPGVVYGPGSFTEGNLVGRLIADHLAHKLPGLVGPENRWSYAYVDDVAAGHCAALEHGRVGGRYALGGENAPQRRVFEIVQRLTGRRPPLRIPFPVADLLGAAEEMRVTLFGGTPLITRGAVDIFRHDWSLDSAEAVRELGYTITPLEDGVARTVSAIHGGRPERPES